MKKQSIINAFVVLAVLSPIIYLMLTWQSIPVKFLSKFHLKETLEQTATRTGLAVGVCVLALVSAALFLVLRNLERLDPKVNNETPPAAFKKLAVVIPAFLVLVNYFLIMSAQYGWVIDLKVVTAFFGLLFAVIGNYFHQIRPNYVAGFRVRWTLNNANNWRKTHQLAGELWFTGGVLICLFSFILEYPLLLLITGFIFVMMLVIPGVYSYKLHRKTFPDARV